MNLLTTFQAYVNLSDIYDNGSNQLKDIICNYDTPLYCLDYTPLYRRIGSKY